MSKFSISKSHLPKMDEKIGISATLVAIFYELFDWLFPSCRLDMSFSLSTVFHPYLPSISFVILVLSTTEVVLEVKHQWFSKFNIQTILLLFFCTNNQVMLKVTEITSHAFSDWHSRNLHNLSDHRPLLSCMNSRLYKP